MIQTAVAAFVGALAALIVLAEIQMASRWVRYAVCLLVGLVITILLGLLLEWIVALISRAA